MFNTAATLCKIETFILQRQDGMVFFASYDKSGKPTWRSDKEAAYQFKSMQEVLLELPKLGLSCVNVIREVYHVIEVEIEPEIIAEEPRQIATG